MPKSFRYFSGTSRTSVHLKLQRSPGQDNMHPKKGKKIKHSLATFKPKISYLLSTAKNTNKNLVSSSAGMFSKGMGFHVMIHWLHLFALFS